MNFPKIFLIGAALAATAVAQTTVQSDTQTSGQASVQANKSGANASGGAAASSSTSASSGSAQSKQANAGLASGTAFNAALSAPLDSKKCKPGDPVTARTTEGVKSDGKTVLPKGTKLVGHVTQASARAKGDAQSALGITFDRAILRNGEEMPLNVAIQAIASAQAAASNAELDTMGDAGAGAAASGMSGAHRSGGGLVSTAGGTVGAVTNTAANVGAAGGGAVNSTVGAAGGGMSHGAVGGLNAAGQLVSSSRGVFGLNGLNLNSTTTNGTEGSLMTSAGKNVHLDSGTRMLMVTQAAASTTPNR
jgi:hypothetical protein